MKKIVLVLLTSLTLSLAVSAQPGGGMQRQSPEQRAAVIRLKLDSAFKIEASKLAILDSALIVLYKKQDEWMQGIFSGGERPDRETMMAERKKYADARDEMIKAIVTEEQYKIWKDTIEPSMRPQRPPGAGGPGGNN